MTRIWQDDAECNGTDDPEAFFAPFEGRDGVRAARRRDVQRVISTYCDACPVIKDCLRTAMAEELPWTRFGIRGGLTPTERDALAKTGAVA